ncbi:Glutathione S-transferase [Marinobacter daqiaonensis]|uniref:Glutathione S-transferase n=1 Tax=Marinobacter daqiaonensis TaxID=650891 RepID=A0A1I6ICA1_9GAMM|nr:glutathione S-transferase family protein [Marinobacter daqiaonensis]SFR64338.1 Glutathione S-transferase [Marinobacter daqiaonensis]
MSDIILHHYAGSPFAEKARMMLGFKGLTWRSVSIPPVMPKPDLTALTGGYRKTPVMQIGADIYCDTAIMARLLDRIQPVPALYPEGKEALAASAAHFADEVMFRHGVAMNFQPHGVAERFKGAPEDVMKAFLADRKKLFEGGSAAPLHPAQAKSQWPALLGRLEQQLAESGSFLMGEEPCIVDFSYYHPLWFVASNKAVANELDPYPQVLAWLEAVAACGHGEHSELPSPEAVEIARDSTPEPVGSGDFDFVDPNGFEIGNQVTVAAVDYGVDPVAGTLVYHDAEEIVVSREDDRAGLVHVHFPRYGFRLAAAG